jgi:hypothetical protein
MIGKQVAGRLHTMAPIQAQSSQRCVHDLADGGWRAW